MLIQLDQIGRMKQGKTILKNISWQIAKGDKWILYGLNGAGKTTLLNILNAYEPATTGGVNLFGKMPGKVGYSAETVRQHIGFVSHSLLEKFQEGERVIDVVISGAFKSIGVYQDIDDEVRNEAHQLLKLVEMFDKANQCIGYLSTGEKQRVMIARALMGQPQVLILDEPAAGLDFIARESLLNILDSLSDTYPTLAMIYVTHFIEEITANFSKILLLKDGQSIQQGAVEDILTSENMSYFFQKNVAVQRWNNRFSMAMLE
ncbi:TPA: ABC transporter ATP-binding protein [Staphylococcus aureus]|nr:ABC transporter ATP-binding protein [Staphylococcus aureus]HDY4497418.1 ABC transporter ATP-binding protein [Staphylococcus aureus]HDY4621385.1 ABC transporter ATP-binding protein [Staphylococcus aureus]HDY4722668.1 ABC transporter ATP-binding protein [Staphylococcus aureus]HDY4752555.1 ABC transporter ATP-binding protein [Staphylococcus aureus]